MLKRWKRIVGSCLLLSAVGIGGTYLYGAGASNTATVTYDTHPIDRGSIRRTVSTSGPVRALVMVSVGTQISGLISRLAVDYNSEVKAGQLLALFDNKTYVAAVSQARAELAMARASLVHQQAALEKAQAMLVEAERRAGRMQALAAKGVAATKLVDDATRDTEVARSDIAVVRAQIESAKANVAVREAALEQAVIALERTEIRSPIDGTVIMRVVDAGQTVTANMSTPELFKIAQDLRRIRIEAQVNEADVGSVMAGNPVTFTVDALPMRRFSGRVTQVRLAATESQGVVTYTAIIEADNEGRRLYPGMTANVSIETAHRRDVLRVPNDALRFKFRKAAPAAGTAQARPSQPAADPLATLAAELRSAIGFDETQIARVLAKLRSVADAADAQAKGAAPDLTVAHVERVVTEAATADQRERLETWKRSRDVMRDVTVHVLGANGTPEARVIRIATADEHHAEIVGGAISPGERVIVRAREAR